MQKCVPHNETIFKIYILGDKVTSEARYSFSGEYFFSNNDSNFFEVNRQNELINSKLVNMTLMFSGIYKRLSEFVGVRICGIDLIIEEGTGDMFLIDYNNFPKFSTWEDLNTPLINLLKKEELKNSK